MKILHLETSSKNCSVAVSDGTDLLCLCEEVSENYKQSESLHTFVNWALEGAEISLKDLDAVSLGMGPGSYTGLRIGAATAKGFCFGLNIPLVATNSMVSMVEAFIGRGYDYIIPLIDARRMEVYTAVFDGEKGEIREETSALILDDSAYQTYRNSKILFVGDGCAKAQDILRLPQAEFKSEVYPSAQYLLRRASEKYINNDFEDVAYFEPFYLKEFLGVKKVDRKKV